jgi:hypothetical protein
MKFQQRYRSRKLAIENNLRGRWFIILTVGQIALFLYLHYPVGGGGQPVSPKSLATSLKASSGRTNKFTYLRPTWRNVGDFLDHCADFDSSTQNATAKILGPLVSLFEDQDYGTLELADILNNYDALKRKPQRGKPMMPSTCIPWVHLETPTRPPRIAMMTMATYSKKSTGDTDNKEGREDKEKKEEEEEEEEEEEDEEERLLLQEGQKASLADKKGYCRQHGYDFYAISDAHPDRPVPWSKIPGALTLPSKKYDWLIWVDVDAVIVDHSVKLEEFIDPRYDAILGLDENGINTGVFFLRNSVWSRLFLAEAWTLTEEPMSHIWWEQAAVMRLIKADMIRNHVKLSPQTHFNSYLRNGKLVDDSFIVHFPGIGKKEKWRHVLEYHGQRKNVLS